MLFIECCRNCSWVERFLPDTRTRESRESGLELRVPAFLKQLQIFCAEHLMEVGLLPLGPRESESKPEKPSISFLNRAGLFCTSANPQPGSVAA